MIDQQHGMVISYDDAYFYQQVADLFLSARQYAKQEMDNTIVSAYFEIGK